MSCVPKFATYQSFTIMTIALHMDISLQLVEFSLSAHHILPTGQVLLVVLVNCAGVQCPESITYAITT